MLKFRLMFGCEAPWQEGRAQEMWKHMMQAGLDFIACSLLRQ